MAEFIRARSAQQKEMRMAEVKAVALAQFADRPYHEITLTTIAGDLGWSRANLYKYVATKEEIFLELSADACDDYYGALAEALPAAVAEVDASDHATVAHACAAAWADVAAASLEWFRLADILMTIIETNVTVERLTEYKRGYFERLAMLSDAIAPALGLPDEKIAPLVNAIAYHAAGIACGCAANPLVAEALERLDVHREPVDFRAEMESFVGIMLAAVLGA